MRKAILKLVELVQKQEIVESAERKEQRWQATLKLGKAAVRKQKYKNIAIRITAAAAVLIGLLVYNTQPLKDVNETSIELMASLLDGSNELLEVTLFLNQDSLISVADHSNVSISQQGHILVNNKPLQAVTKTNSKAGAYAQLIAPKGKRTSLRLSDNTKLNLNSGTRVVFPRQFKNSTREIYVDGEVYIEVSPDKTKPFIVKTPRDFEIEVLGTSFNICTYKELSAASVVLVEGAVRVTDSQEHQVKLSPNEMVLITDASVGNALAVHASDYTSWTTGTLILNSEPLSNVVARLGIHFGEPVDIDTRIREINISGKLDLSGTLPAILEGLTNIITTPLSYFVDEAGVHTLREK